LAMRSGSHACVTGSLASMVLTMGLRGEQVGLMFSEGALKVYNSPREDKRRIDLVFRHRCPPNAPASPRKPIHGGNCSFSSQKLAYSASPCGKLHPLE
jgi:hypothetical protein